MINNVFSMTGFGKSEGNISPQKKVLIEIKSLNSKSIEVGLKLPNLLKSKELEIRNIIIHTLIRGKIDVYVQLISEKNSGIKINTEQIMYYLEQLHEIKDHKTWSEADKLQFISTLPDITTHSQEEFSEVEWNALLTHLEAAIHNVMEFRKAEGISITKDLEKNIHVIKKLLQEIMEIDQTRTDEIRSKIKLKILEYIDEQKVDNNRLEQELIYYIEKSDTSEEKARLQQHLVFFEECMLEKNDIGKKLGFITQEIGREINTLGSKTNHADIQKKVVLMKDALEKIKEQCANVL